MHLISQAILDMGACGWDLVGRSAKSITGNVLITRMGTVTVAEGRQCSLRWPGSHP